MSDANADAHPRRFGRPEMSGASLFQRIVDAYGLVLVLVLTTFVVTATLSPEGWAGRILALAVAGVTAIVAFTSSDVRRERVRLAVGVALIAIVVAVLARITASQFLIGIAFVIIAGLLVVAAATVLQRVVFATEVDFRTILGAVSVYTLIGLLFGYLYIALGHFAAGDVFAGVSDAQAQDYLFFSYTTLTSTGYGNLVPDGQIGEILAVFEMLSGQIFLVTLVAGLVSLWRPGSRVAGARRRDRDSG